MWLGVPSQNQRQNHETSRGWDTTAAWLRHDTMTTPASPFALARSAVFQSSQPVSKMFFSKQDFQEFQFCSVPHPSLTKSLPPTRPTVHFTVYRIKANDYGSRDTCQKERYMQGFKVVYIFTQDTKHGFLNFRARVCVDSSCRASKCVDRVASRYGYPQLASGGVPSAVHSLGHLILSILASDSPRHVCLPGKQQLSGPCTCSATQ